LHGSRKAARIGLIGLNLFRHPVPILVLWHLTQELLKLPTALLTHFALKVSKRFINRLGLSE
jgi:hypothetical protein